MIIIIKKRNSEAPPTELIFVTSCYNDILFIILIMIKLLIFT